LVLKRFGVAQPGRRVFRCAAGYSRQPAFLTAKGKIQNVRREQMLIKFGGVQPKLFPDWLNGSAIPTVHLLGTPGQML
jgi:hypothetical protein